MTDPAADRRTGERDRLVAWDRELRAAHERLRDALRVAREAASADAESAGRDLLLYCRGFCLALSAHHRGEDDVLFPVLQAEHPEISQTISALRQDHGMIAHLLGGLELAVDGAPAPDDLARHLEGIAAIMESHFRYEERSLDAILAELALDEEPGRVFGML
ncbi:hemerythrin domain-containing protein [Microbacterium sp. CJ88]|uniref:hemerythrin domain-containing protein n=1 Tax=Microbacterium sp. CJ88 TaxID=3445672 RepID=UPI003F655C63